MDQRHRTGASAPHRRLLPRPVRDDTSARTVRSAVTLDDVRGDQLERLALLRRERRRQRSLGLVDHRQGARANLLQRAGRRDRVADALGGAGVADRARIERGKLRVGLAREDQRQRDRAVEQVGAARLARTLDRTADVEDVVEQLEREPDPASERAERRRTRRAGGVALAELAGNLEQARGLQLAALEVALDGDVGAPRILALQQLAARQRGRRPGQQPNLIGV